MFSKRIAILLLLLLLLAAIAWPAHQRITEAAENTPYPTITPYIRPIVLPDASIASY